MSVARRNWDAIEAPVTIPDWVVTPSQCHIFMFSAVTWNRHEIHYSKDAAISEGHADVVVQRALLGNYLVNMITRWIGSSAELRRIAWKVVQSAVPNRPIRCQGEIVELIENGDDRYAECDVRIVADDDSLIAVGTATIALNSTPR